MSLYVTTNPATGETLAEFDTLDDDGVRSAIGHAQSGSSPGGRRRRSSGPTCCARSPPPTRERPASSPARSPSRWASPSARPSGEVEALADAIYAVVRRPGPGAPRGREARRAGCRVESVVRKLPVGSLIGVMPWNFPYYQVARFAAPNLMLGNTILLKHAPSCPQSALLMEEIFNAAGLVKDAYVNIFATNDQIADDDRRPAGPGRLADRQRARRAAVAEVAGRNLKKVVLELGGSDAFIVLDSAGPRRDREVGHPRPDVQHRPGLQRREAVRRHRAALRRVRGEADRLVRADDARRPDGRQDRARARCRRSPRPTLSPSQVDKAVEQGATVLTGGKKVDGPGAFFEPTLLADVTPRHGRLLRGALRPGRGRLQGRLGRRGRRAHQLLVLRAQRLGVELRRGPGPRDADRLEVGMAFVNEHGTTMPGPALRWREALRLRPRARAVGHGRVRQQEARPGLEGEGPQEAEARRSDDGPGVASR